MGEIANVPRGPSPRIAGLDGLRAISIALVLVAHAWPTIPASGTWEWIEPYAGNSSLGVTTFFVVSGYLITWLLRQEQEASGAIRLRSFYMRRVLRIFPAFYAYLLVVTSMRLLGRIDTTPHDIAFAGTFLTNYERLFRGASNVDYWFVGHFWTLSLEEQFYLLWPAALVIAGLRRAPRVAATIIVLAPAVRVASYFLWPGTRGQLSMMLHTAADPLMFGCLIALWQGRPSLEKFLERCSSWYWPLLAGFFLLVASAWLAARFGGAYRITVGLTLNSAAIAFVILWVVRAPKSRLTRLLSAPIVRRVGVLSYSLYLWQQLFLTKLNHGWTGVFPLNVLACFVVAELSFRLVESPFLRLRKRFQPARGALPGMVALPLVPSSIQD